jgi:hypothetical protein
VNVVICRPDVSVEVCEMTACPTDWVTRNGTKSSTFNVEGDVANIIGAKLYTRTWGDASQPVSINGTALGNLPGGGYHTSFDSIVIDASKAKSAFKSGENTITVTGGGHHGEEVMYPGPMPVIQYSASNECPATSSRPAVRHVSENQGVRIISSGNPASLTVLSDHACDISLVRLDGGVVGAASVRKGERYSIDASLPGGVYLVRVIDGGVLKVQRVVIGR